MINTGPAGRLRLADALGRMFGSFSWEVLVEPGPTLAGGFFSAGDLVDRVWVFRSPTRVDDPTAPGAAGVPEYYVESGRIDLDGDALTEYLNPRSSAYFANAPSADLVLTRS
jgi:riboflavin biosynthesis pyrimidine reductase